MEAGADCHQTTDCIRDRLLVFLPEKRGKRSQRRSHEDEGERRRLGEEVRLRSGGNRGRDNLAMKEGFFPSKRAKGRESTQVKSQIHILSGVEIPAAVAAVGAESQ